MSKFPLLEQLRADRRRLEDEITEPYRAELDEAARMIRSLRASLQALERVMGTEIAMHMTAEIAHQLSGELRRLVMEAVAKAGHASDGVTLTVGRETLAFMDPKTLERQILDRYVEQSIPALSLRVDDLAKAVDESITVLGHSPARARLPAICFPAVPLTPTYLERPER